MTQFPSIHPRHVVAITAAAMLVGAPTALGAGAEQRATKAAAQHASDTAVKATQQGSARPTRAAAAKRRAKGPGKHPRRARALSEVSLAGALARVAKFSGPTGVVVHSRTVTVDLTSGDARRTPGQLAESERWSEIGGGRRGHYRNRTVDAASGAELQRLEGWTSPQLSVVRPGSGGTVVTVACTPFAVPDPDIQLRADRAALATLPDGPVIDGVPTRVGVHTVGASELRHYLDATTGRPVRTTQQAPGAAAPELQTTYLAWEERPAGGAAADLVPDIPADAKLAPYSAPTGCPTAR